MHLTGGSFEGARPHPRTMNLLRVALYGGAFLIRAESTYSAHPGVGLFVRYIQWDPGEHLDGIIDSPGAPFPRQERLGAILTTFLAVRVF